MESQEKKTYQRTELAREEAGNDIVVTVEMSRLELGGGRLGRPMLAMILRRGERFLRLGMDRDPSEAELLREAMGRINLDPQTYEEYRRTREAWEAEEYEARVARDQREGGDGKGKPQKGLGQYSRPGKTERKRKRQNGGNRLPQQGAKAE